MTNSAINDRTASARLRTPPEISIDVTELRVTIEAPGASHDVHLTHSDQLEVALHHGKLPADPNLFDGTGIVLISLDDFSKGGHDEVHWAGAAKDAEEHLLQAREALDACCEALKRIKKA